MPRVSYHYTLCFFICNFINLYHKTSLQWNIFCLFPIWMKWGGDCINSSTKLKIFNFACLLLNINKMEHNFAWIYFIFKFIYRVSELGLHKFSFKSIPSKKLCKMFHQKPTENLCLCIFVVENASFEALPLFVCHVCNVEAGGRA